MIVYKVVMPFDGWPVDAYSCLASHSIDKVARYQIGKVTQSHPHLFVFSEEEAARAWKSEDNQFCDWEIWECETSVTYPCPSEIPSSYEPWTFDHFWETGEIKSVLTWIPPAGTVLCDDVLCLRRVARCDGRPLEIMHDPWSHMPREGEEE